MSNNTKTSKVVKSKDPNIQQTTKVLEVGKFYLIFDGSAFGHPGYIIWKNDTHNLYLAIKFGTSPQKHNKSLNKSIGKTTKQSMIYNRPFLGKKKDFGKKELIEMKITKEEETSFKNSINLVNPVYSKNINRKDKKFFIWAIKNPLQQGQLSDPKGPSDIINIQKAKATVKK